MEYTYIFNYNDRTVFHGDTAIGFIDERDNNIYDTIMPTYLSPSERVGYLDPYLRDTLRDPSGEALGYIDDYNNVLDRWNTKVGYLEGDLIYDRGANPVGKVVGPAKRAGAAAFLLMHERFHSEGKPYYPVEQQYTQSAAGRRYHPPKNWAKEEDLASLKFKMILYLILSCIVFGISMWICFQIIGNPAVWVRVIPFFFALIILRASFDSASVRYFACKEDEEYLKQNGQYPNYRWYEGTSPHTKKKLWWVKK